MQNSSRVLSVAANVAKQFPQVQGACERISAKLTSELIAHGIPAKHVVGIFTLDEPEAHKYIVKKAWQDASDEYEVEHDWVEVEGRILDVTAKQFRKSVEQNIPDIVYIGHTDPLYVRYNHLKHHHG